MLAECLHRPAMREQHMVQRPQDIHPGELQARRLDAVAMAQAQKTLGLVERHPMRNPIA